VSLATQPSPSRPIQFFGGRASALFDALDTNHDGVLTREEFAALDSMNVAAGVPLPAFPAKPIPTYAPSATSPLTFTVPAPRTSSPPKVTYVRSRSTSPIPSLVFKAPAARVQRVSFRVPTSQGPAVQPSSDEATAQSNSGGPAMQPSSDDATVPSTSQGEAGQPSSQEVPAACTPASVPTKTKGGRLHVRLPPAKRDAGVVKELERTEEQQVDEQHKEPAEPDEASHGDLQHQSGRNSMMVQTDLPEKDDRAPGVDATTETIPGGVDAMTVTANSGVDATTETATSGVDATTETEPMDLGASVADLPELLKLLDEEDQVNTKLRRAVGLSSQVDVGTDPMAKDVGTDPMAADGLATKAAGKLRGSDEQLQVYHYQDPSAARKVTTPTSPDGASTTGTYHERGSMTNTELASTTGSVMGGVTPGSQSDAGQAFGGADASVIDMLQPPVPPPESGPMLPCSRLTRQLSPRSRRQRWAPLQSEPGLSRSPSLREQQDFCNRLAAPKKPPIFSKMESPDASNVTPAFSEDEADADKELRNEVSMRSFVMASELGSGEGTFSSPSSMLGYAPRRHSTEWLAHLAKPRQRRSSAPELSMPQPATSSSARLPSARAQRDFCKRLAMPKKPYEGTSDEERLPETAREASRERDPNEGVTLTRTKHRFMSPEDSANGSQQELLVPDPSLDAPSFEAAAAAALAAASTIHRESSRQPPTPSSPTSSALPTGPTSPTSSALPTGPTVNAAEAFARIDTNGDGLLSRAEIIKACRVDPEVCGLLGLPQWIRQEDGSRDIFETVFQGLDADSSRYIDLAEFMRVFEPGDASPELRSSTEFLAIGGPKSRGQRSPDFGGAGKVVPEDVPKPTHARENVRMRRTTSFDPLRKRRYPVHCCIKNKCLERGLHR